MKKRTVEKISEDEVWLCNICGGELESGYNDWGSFDYCEKCKIDNFIDSKLKPIRVKKVVEYVTKYEFIKG